MSDPGQSSYDVVPYPAFPFPQSHPDRLATVATLLGLTPPGVERCRVLELGCAAGGNLLPLAVSLPDSTFVGIDLSSRQIADGQKTISAVGLKNVEMRHLSIKDVGPDLGQFDYIIAHGIYSWVPPEVREKILEVCAQNLTPNGIAYVSYNTYPGWHMRAMIRDMMLYHSKRFTDTQAVIREARGFLDFVAQSVAQDKSPFSLLLKNEVDELRKRTDSYLYHEHLEECNEPVYFHQFVERARAKGLEYLGEADINVMVPSNFRPEIEAVLQRLSSDTVQIEQYMDFVRNRTFRETLLCHKGIKPNYQISPKQLGVFLVASPVKPVSARPELRSFQIEAFQGPDGVSLSSGDPLVKSALLHLSEIFPRSVPFDQLRQIARDRLSEVSIREPATIARDAQTLGKALLSSYTKVSTRAIELHMYQAPFTLEISEAPRASPLARHQATHGNAVTSLRHEMLGLEDFDRYVLMRLDGARTRPVLVDELVGLVQNGTLVVEQDGKPMTGEANIRKAIASSLEQRLQKLARQALLMA